jgi:hypothetical protein
MKTIIFSFDDARQDFYSRAFPILQKYSLTATLNVISDFILSPSKYTTFGSGCNQSMTPQELIDCQNNGIEIACHGHLHLNTQKDILLNIKHLQEMGLKFPNGIGFASPNSEITDKNKNDNRVWELYQNGMLSYIRSGTQILREGFFFALLSIVDRFIHSPKLWYWLNHNNIIHTKKNDGILPSMTIHSYTTLKQILYMIEKMPNNSAIILMFHSICAKADKGYGKDKWYWDVICFEELCKYIQEKKSMINMITNIDYIHS